MLQRHVALCFCVLFVIVEGASAARAQPAPAPPPNPPAPGDAAGGTAAPIEPLPHAPLDMTGARAALVERNVPLSPTPAAPVPPSDAQLEKFHAIYQNATKVFGDEHTVITPMFFVGNDLDGRLSATDKRQAGVSAVLMVPLVGGGGGHGVVDWWPVVTSSDYTKVYTQFLDQLAQYNSALEAAGGVPADVKAILRGKWSFRTLRLAKQLFCHENLDQDVLPANVHGALEKLCALEEHLPPTASAVSPTAEAAGAQPPAVPGAARQDLKDPWLVVDAVRTKLGSDITSLVPRRHNLLIGPALGIPLTKNPTDIFQLGAAAEVGGASLRFAAAGGLVGRYQGATYKDVFAAGWFVGLALSGEIGDELFHYFNGGSALISNLARVAASPTGDGNGP